jgi:lipid II:glycine glycyltransferase (peptidoglycan interpeptide bridge formation enzyme)
MFCVRRASINDLDVEEWNELLLKSKVCDAFQTYEWAKVLENSMNIQPFFLTVHKGSKTIGGVMLLRKRILGMFDAYEIRGGPLYVNEVGSIVVMRKVLRSLEKEKGKLIYLLFIPFPTINCRYKALFKDEGYYGFPFCTIVIDLRRSLEEIWGSLNKKARWGVRKAERLGVRVEIANTWQEWEKYYHLHIIHGMEKQYSTYPHEFFRKMFALHHKGMARLFVAKHEKRIIAGSLFLVYRENMVFLQNASLRAFLPWNPNNLIQWRSIEWAKENGVITYDMNGLPWEKTPYLRGVYNYKKRWNGKVHWYYYYLNKRILYRGLHLIRVSSLAWRFFSQLRSHGVI